MKHAARALIGILTLAACADPAAPPAPESASLARQSGGKSGIVITDLGTLGGNESRVMGLNTPALTRQLLIVGQSNVASGAILPAYWYVNTLTLQKTVASLALPSAATVPNESGGFDFLDYRAGWGFDVNTNEQIVGYGAQYKNGSYNGDRAVAWSGPSATPTFLAGLENTAALAGAINEAGHAAGYLAYGTTEERAFFFDGVKTTVLASLGGPAQARDVNIDGVVVGHSLTSPTAPFSTHRAFVSVPSGSPFPLPDLLGGRSSASSINDAGVIVGYALNLAGESRAVRWTGSIATGYVITDLGLTNARAWDINRRGEIVGSFVGRQGERGFYQTALGVTKELPILGYAGIAYAINENAQIVGISWFHNTYSHAVLWTGVR